MTSVSYALFVSNPDALSARGWAQTWDQGELRWRDAKETGSAGTFLDAWLDHCLSMKREALYDYGPSPEYERLALWFLDKGVDPWLPHKGLTAWERALDLGWPGLIKALAEHPSAPSREALEGVLVKGAGSVDLPAPLSFAKRNQIEALQAWAAQGMDVNLTWPAGSTNNAGVHAQTPEFIKAWADTGGNVEIKDSQGRDLPAHWRRFPSAQFVLMEKAWRSTLPEREKDPVALATKLANELTGLNKTLLMHRFRADGLTWDSPTQSGQSIRDVLLGKLKSDPRGFGLEPSVIASALEKVPFQVAWDAMVAGLRVRSKNATAKAFPTPKQIVAFVGSQNDVAGALDRLARDVADCPHALICLFHVSNDLAPKLPDERAAAQKSYFMEENAQAFWGRWFQRHNEEGVAQGWQALTAWALEKAYRNEFSTKWQAVLQGLPPETVWEGKELLRGIQCLLSPPANATSLEALGHLNRSLRFLGNLPEEAPETPLSPAMERLEAWFFNRIQEVLSESEAAVVGPWVAQRREAQLERRFVSVGPSGRARF